ncbi:unnamed protein product [Rangifer tarandus platyrhynchus]|uniref:Uncharacterized protein n=1 Tax=Rangifer tarandus platyrhynchus TaxID=3082113 RepID=A0ABN8XYG6_RANTA|nr:unnamed protein product [Rangifer tarandus platyrhynchus]
MPRAGGKPKKEEWGGEKTPLNLCFSFSSARHALASYNAFRSHNKSWNCKEPRVRRLIKTDPPGRFKRIRERKLPLKFLSSKAALITPLRALLGCVNNRAHVGTHAVHCAAGSIIGVKSILACEIPKPGEFRSSPDEDDLQDNRDQAEEKVGSKARVEAETQLAIRGDRVLKQGG